MISYVKINYVTWRTGCLSRVFPYFGPRFCVRLHYFRDPVGEAVWRMDVSPAPIHITLKCESKLSLSRCKTFS